MASPTPSDKAGKRRKDRQRPLRRIDMGLRGNIPFHQPFEIPSLRNTPWAVTMKSNRAIFCGQDPGTVSQVSEGISYRPVDSIMPTNLKHRLAARQMQRLQQNAQLDPNPSGLNRVTYPSTRQDIHQNTQLTVNSSGYHLQNAPQRYYRPSREQIAEAAAKAARIAQKKRLETIHKGYDKAFEQNMWELEFGSDCACDRHQWHAPTKTCRRGR